MKVIQPTHVNSGRALSDEQARIVIESNSSVGDTCKIPVVKKTHGMNLTCPVGSCCYCIADTRNTDLTKRYLKKLTIKNLKKR